MRHVVMYSGGITSWAVARRVVDEHGPDDVTLLFADTLIEHEDLYRFLRESSERLGAELVWLQDGRTPFGVFRDVRWIGNDRAAPCSRELKQKPCRKWIDENCDPDTTTVYVGIDWSEMHRMPAIERGYRPWTVDAPLTRPPYSVKWDLIEECRAWGVEPCVMYRQGAQHANCGGGCVRAGQAAWAHLLRTDRNRFLEWERDETALRAELGQGSILADRRGLDGSARRPLPLVEFRRRLDREEEVNGPGLFDEFDWGGCGCLPNPDEDAEL